MPEEEVTTTARRVRRGSLGTRRYAKLDLQRVPAVETLRLVNVEVDDDDISRAASGEGDAIFVTLPTRRKPSSENFGIARRVMEAVAGRRSLVGADREDLPSHRL